MDENPFSLPPTAVEGFERPAPLWQLEHEYPAYTGPNPPPEELSVPLVRSYRLLPRLNRCSNSPVTQSALMS